jgi:hypothetical protein
VNCLPLPRTSIAQIVAPGLPRAPGLERTEANPPFLSSETWPSKTAWPDGSWRSLLRETPPITRSSMAAQSLTVPGLPKSNSIEPKYGG